MTAAARHNGGITQTNLNGLQTGGEYPFLNCLKHAQMWSYRDNSGHPTPLELDADGYLSDASVVTNHSGINTVFFVPTQTARPGNYIVKWDGNGTIALDMTQTPFTGFSSADLTSTTGSGRYKFVPGTTQFTVGISAVGSPHITNIRVCHESDEAALDAGDVFGVQFKQTLTTANFGVIRFLNWQDGNTSNVTSFASSRSESYYIYGHREFRSGIYAGTTSLSGTKISVAAPSKNIDGTSWAGLSDKATVQAKMGNSVPPILATFTNGNASIAVPSHGRSVNDKVRINIDPGHAGTVPTNFALDTTYFVVSVPDADHMTVSLTQGGTAIVAGSAQTGTVTLVAVLTLNVGATGDIEVWDSYGQALSAGGNSMPVAGNMATFIYDAILNKWLKWGGDTAELSCGLTNGAPISICVRLCAEVGAHPHFIAPPQALDPMTDFITSVATYVRDNGPSWMRLLQEGPNELWNTSGGFFQTNYASAKATGYGWTGDYHSWMGKVMSTIGQAVSAVYSADRSRYEVICGVQTGRLDSPTINDQRFKSAEYVGQASAAQSGYIKDPAYNWVTAGACAQYYVPAFKGTQQEIDMATAYAASTTQTQKDNLTNSYVDGVNNAGSFTLPDLTALYANFKAYLLGLPTPIRKMVGYEGCYSPDYAGNDTVNTLRFAARMAPNQGAYLRAIYAAWFALSNSDGSFSALYPSNYILGDFNDLNGAVPFAGNQSSYIWAIFQGDIHATPTPQYTAICAINAVKRANPLRMRLHG